jgi:hypothetical protein
MSTMRPEFIHERTVSQAWGRAFLLTMERAEDQLPPFFISIENVANIPPPEDARIRDAVDDALVKNGKYRCAASAVTIFPYNHWRRTQKQPRQSLYTWYQTRFLPRARARDGANQYGTYFERMIGFTGVRRENGKDTIKVVNQLEHILHEWERERARPKRPRQSALQLACFDPAKDHTGQPIRGFPCLQQVSFSYRGNDLAVHAYYPTQYIFDRAYGNYLGLAHLGQFVAHELKLRFARLNIFVAHPELGKGITKTGLRNLASLVESCLIAPAPQVPAPNTESAARRLVISHSEH